MNSTGMFILTVLISLAITAQNGWTVSALENPSATLNAAGIRTYFNGATEGRSNEDSQRHSSLRRLVDITTSTSTPIPSVEDILAESAEALAEAVEENIQGGKTIAPGDEDALNASIEELEEAVEKMEEGKEEEKSSSSTTTTEATAAGATDFAGDNDQATVVTVFVGDNSTAETTYPVDESAEKDITVTESTGATPEATEDNATDVSTSEQPLLMSTEAPAPGDDVDNNLVYDPNLPLPPINITAPGDQPDLLDTTPSPSFTGSQDELSNGEDEDEEGEPLIFESTLSPSAAGGKGEGDVKAPAPTPYPNFNEDEEYGTDYPTIGEEATYDWGGSPWDSTPAYPTDPPTPRPTFLYVPKSGDPLIEIEVPDAEAPDAEDFNDDDKVFYHGLGGKVGSYLDGVESPQDMEKDKNVQIVTGTLVASFMVAMLIAAHLVMQYPDGLCAGCCRLTLKVICCFTRTLCLPCRAICCKGSDQSQSRRTHAPMRTPFPTDLELA